MPKKNPHSGSTLREFLADDGRLEEAEAQAIKRVFAWQLEKARKESRLVRLFAAN